MAPGATRTGSILHVGDQVDLVRHAVANAATANLGVRSVTNTDDAGDELAEAVALVVETTTDGWRDLVSAAEDVDPPVPTLVLTPADGTRNDAIAAGATDVFVRTDDERALLARRLENVLAAGSGKRPTSAGEVRGIVGTGRDDSGRKDRERELAVIETVFEEAQDAIFLIDVDDDDEFRIERVNPAYEESTGMDATVLRGMRPQDLVGEGTASDVAERYRECVEQQTPIEYEERLEIDGERRDWHTKLAPVVEDGEVVELVGATRDVTERKQLQRELKEQANLLDHIFNQVPSALYVKDEEARHVRKRNFENDPQEYFGKTDLDLYPDELGTKTHADDMRVIENGDRIINKEEYNPANDQWVITSKVPWHDEDGNIQGLIGVSRDITEKKQFERELRLRKRAMEEAPVGISIHEAAADYAIRYVNDCFTEQTGYDRASLEGGTLDLLAGTETATSELDELEAAFETGDSASVVTILYRNDRTPFWGHVHIAPVTDGDGEVTHFVGFLQDVTDDKEYEQTIERRLDEFGDVLAQQLRPPLVGAQEALQSATTGDSTAIEDAEASIERAEQLIEDLAAVNTFSVKSRAVSERTTMSVADED